MQRNGGALERTGGAKCRTDTALQRSGVAPERTGGTKHGTGVALQRTGGAKYRAGGAKDRTGGAMERSRHVLPLEPAAARTSGPLISFYMNLIRYIFNFFICKFD